MSQSVFLKNPCRFHFLQPCTQFRHHGRTDAQCHTAIHIIRLPKNLRFFFLDNTHHIIHKRILKHNSHFLVHRYFGGIKLGTSGLIQAYKAAAIEAIQAARIIEKTVDEEITFFFEYPFMNSVMRIVKEEEPSIVRQGYEHDCSMTLRIRKGSMPRLKSRLEKVETLRFEDDGE